MWPGVSETTHRDDEGDTQPFRQHLPRGEFECRRFVSHEHAFAQLGPDQNGDEHGEHGAAL